MMSGEGRIVVFVDGREEKKMEIVDDDLYNLWKGEFGKHVLEMTIDQGVRVHAFTFGK